MQSGRLAIVALLILLALMLPAAFAEAGAPYPYRLVWVWGNLDDSEGTGADLAAAPRFVQLVDVLQSMNVNGLVLPVNPAGAQFGRQLRQLRATSEILAKHGIGTYVYLHYAPPEEPSSPKNLKNCPYSLEFARRWNDLADKLFAGVPLLKGYVIKGTGYERIPGPTGCKCAVCSSKTEQEKVLKAISVLSESVRKHRGVIFYRTWMTGALQDKEYRLFAPLSGKLPDNVFLVSKIGYGDFGIKEIPHPLFGHVQPASQHIAEFQVFGEYRGRTYNPCEMVTNWGKWMRTNKDKIGGMIGDVVIGKDSLDHPLNMVNWYAFGRYAADPDASAEKIINEWSEKTYGKKAAHVVADVVKRTSAATWELMYFRGIWVQQHSWLPTPHYLDTRLRGPWVDLQRDPKLIGWGRPLDVFPAEEAAQYARDPNFELFVSRKPITPALLAELSAQQDRAVKEYETMLETWRQGKSLMPAKQYEQVEHLLKLSLNDARIWRQNVRAFIALLLGKDCKPEVSTMRDLAAKAAGTALTRQPLTEVLKGYAGRAVNGQ